MVDQYDSMYTYYFCLRHRYATFDGVKVLDGSSDTYSNPVYLLPIDESRKKYNEIYWPFEILEQFEMEITDD